MPPLESSKPFPAMRLPLCLRADDHGPARFAMPSPADTGPPRRHDLLSADGWLAAVPTLSAVCPSHRLFAESQGPVCG